MDQLCQHIKNLKAVLLTLPPTGEKGFEGLIKIALQEITGVPFRLAKSGSQFGIDGKSVYETEPVCFEGKRYSNNIPRSEVLSKIADLSIKNSETDIWVLGATSQVSAQLNDDARNLGEKHGIVVLILDWPEKGLPLLAVTLAMGGNSVQDFLKATVNDALKQRNAREALEAVKNSTDFANHEYRIREICNQPASGLALALKANTVWLNDAFSGRNRAKTKLGQPLSPADVDTKRYIPVRKNLTVTLQPFMANAHDERVVFVLGGEGHGKSWIIAQSWITLEHKPLMVFMSPDEFAEVASQNKIIDLFISRLIEQTDDSDTETKRERWKRRLSQWKKCPLNSRPRFVFVIDGINQRPKTDWARIVEKIDSELSVLGGQLIVSSRTLYFRERIKCRLSVPFKEIIVPEWTETERDDILTHYGISASNGHNIIAKSLCNPRLLGIALELFDKDDVTNFEELSVSRLLFEHMRMQERDSPAPKPVPVFAKELMTHAQEILSRIKTQQQDDLHIFEDELSAVADGRFYQEVDGDATRYSLQGEGLTLALGFSVIDRLRQAKRNGKNIDAELEGILDPIAALDDTAKVILAALTVSTLQTPYEPDIIASLIKGFTVLQNPDQTKFPAMVGLVKMQPQGFLDAAYALSLAGGHQRNFDWIKGSLTDASKNNHAWKVISDKVHSWLSSYSLSPEVGIFLPPERDPQDKIQEEREKNHKKLKTKLLSLSNNEHAIMNNMHAVEGDLSTLWHLALKLLAGKPLEQFVQSFLNLIFSYCFNSDHHAPVQEFQHLVILNKIDWANTRTALLHVSDPLREGNVSTTGKWALVIILRATGDSEDAKEAEELVKVLNKDRQLFESWRLVEKYCATDPCDPSSEKPENITQTAEEYAAINICNLQCHRSQDSEDLFFEMARPGIARFIPNVGIAKHRALAEDLLLREGIALRITLFKLYNHNALLSAEYANKLVNRWREAKKSGTKFGQSESESWILYQYHLLLAFPFLSALEQTNILLSDEMEENILSKLIEIAKPLREDEYEKYLKKACLDNNERNKYFLLALAHFTAVPLSSDVRDKISSLILSESTRVRTQALGIIANSDNDELLTKFLQSDWNAADADTETDFEISYGSAALLNAAAKDLIRSEDALNRISPRFYGRAIVMLDKNSVCEIARRIDVSIKYAVGLDCELVTPNIQRQIHTLKSIEPERFDLSTQESSDMDIAAVFKVLSESEKDFEARQKHNYDTFLEFKAKLTLANALIILDDIRLDEFAILVETDNKLANQWYDLFMTINEKKLPIIHNLALLLAHAFGKKYPHKAKELFNRISNSVPLVELTDFAAELTLDLIAIWAGVRNSDLDALRFNRLDRTRTDYDLSIEVLAALLNNKQDLLIDYIESKLCKAEPAEIARGIMVAGFSDQSAYNNDIINRYKDYSGLLENACKAARYAYERNVWSRHWYSKMCLANENTDFWRFEVLFSEIIDGRFSVWKSLYEKKCNPILLFEHTIDELFKNRLEKWKNKRNKKLFGLDAPSSIFLDGNQDI